MLSEAAIFVKQVLSRTHVKLAVFARNQSAYVLFMRDLGVKWRIAAVVNF